MTEIKFKAPKCPHCQQTTQVLYALDHGTADLVKAVLVRVRIKGKNVVHLRNEMEVAIKDFTHARLLNEGVITSNMTNNAIRATKHGLLAKVKYESGSYCITKKGAAFLRGEPVPRYALQDKATKHLIGYYKPELYSITIHELRLSEEPYWKCAAFDIVEGEFRASAVQLREQSMEPLF